MINAVGNHGHSVRMVGPQFCDCAVGGSSDLCRASVAAMHHQYNGGTKIGGDLGIERQLAAGRYVCVVRANDQDHVKSITELTETLNDDVHGLISILACCIVGDADGLVVGLRDSWLIHEKINNEVDVVVAR